MPTYMRVWVPYYADAIAGDWQPALLPHESFFLSFRTVHSASIDPSPSKTQLNLRMNSTTGGFARPYMDGKLLPFSGTLTSSVVVSATLVAFVIHRLIIIVYRLYFHPLSSFPGPRLAAITSLYEWYYAILYPKPVPWVEYQRSVLHPKYGPIVRVRPDALHITDPEAYRQIHKVGSKFQKARFFYGLFNLESTLFGSVDLESHRKRRALVAPLFTKPEITGLYERTVKEKVSLLVSRVADVVRKKGGQGRVPMEHALSAFTFDISAEVIFNGGFDVLKSRDMRHQVTDSVDLVVEAAILNRYFPSFIPLINSIPAWFMKLVYPVALGQKTLRDAVKDEVDKLVQQKRTGTFDDTKERAIIAQLLSHLDPQTVEEEGYTMLGAAIHTTQWSIQRHLYHLAVYPGVQEKVLAELKSAYPDKDSDMSYAKLESLPYFAAFMKEANRLAHAIPGSVPRETPMDESTEFCGRHIPPGTILESDMYNMHLHEGIFPNPEKLEPERWLQGDKSKTLEKFLLHFNMGNYMCVGYTLANLTMYIAVAAFVRKFEIKLTPELEKEGFLFEAPWTAVKRGAAVEYICRERTE
ncbi:putative cytochrome P450 [Cladorrhinum sp. PSN259]|nr:putative cytochrome P450 [Cladorrhinum sp. PSN259]